MNHLTNKKIFLLISIFIVFPQLTPMVVVIQNPNFKKYLG